MIFKNWINTVFGSTGALTGSDIPYDGADSLTDKIDQVEGDIKTKASQAEVDAGTDDTKFVTSLTLENKPVVGGLLTVKAFGHFTVAGTVVTDVSSSNLSMVRDSNGLYTCTISGSVVSNNDYLLRISSGNEGTAAVRSISEVSYETRSTTSFRVKSETAGGGGGDVDTWFIEVLEV